MAITRTDIVGTKIICEIESSNLVKTEYDVTINAEDITKSKTVNDLFKIVKERIAS